MPHWACDAFFYHIYPLGFCGAPFRNDFASPAVPRLDQLYSWIGHLQNLGINALYLGPVFESSVHGYDTADYYQVDRRLGNNETLARISAELHRQGIRLILDGVFNHVGRDFWAFRDVLTHEDRSAYRDWFQGLRFEGRSPYNDPFVYEGWNGHYSLVKLNLHHPAVRDHLFQAVAAWIRDFDIDGLRLDTADCIDLDFLKELAAFCRRIRPDFWLMGEVIHGDYRRWVNRDTLDSVTNYECYKGLYSSHVDKNYFEIAYSLNRQFGEGGVYADLPLYTFADNHDVNRVASSLSNRAHLYTLYALLLTMPGVPSIYYGSEWGIEGRKVRGDDRPLRPHLVLEQVSQSSPERDLARAIARFAGIRRNSRALRYGNYRQLLIEHQLLAFSRQTAEECVIVALNASDAPLPVDIDIPGHRGRQLSDLLNQGETFPISGSKARIDRVPPHWARILRVE